MSAPAAAQVRNPITNSTAKMLTSHRGVGRARQVNQNATAVMATISTVMPMLTACTSAGITGSWMRSLSVESR